MRHKQLDLDHIIFYHIDHFIFNFWYDVNWYIRNHGNIGGNMSAMGTEIIAQYFCHDRSIILQIIIINFKANSKTKTHYKKASVICGHEPRWCSSMMALIRWIGFCILHMVDEMLLILAWMDSKPCSPNSPSP